MFAFTRWVAVSFYAFLAGPLLEYILGPVPWLYVAEIFPTRTRHYGVALASSSQWLWSKFYYLLLISILILDWKISWSPKSRPR